MNNALTSLDIAGSYARGREVYQARQEEEQKNALRGFLQQNGGALLNGDQNALAAYAQYDPQAAFGMQRQNQQMGMERERLALDRRQTEQIIAASRAGMANDATRLQFAREEGKRQAAEFALTLDDRQRAELAAKAKSASETALVAYKQGPEAWDRWNNDNPEFEDVSYEDAPIKISTALGALDALMPQPAPTAVQNRAGMAVAGGLTPDTPEYRDYMLNGEVQRTETATAPSGYRFNGPDLEAIPGGPADPKVGARTAVPTEGERKAAGMFDRMEAAERTLDGLAGQGAQNLSLMERGMTRAGVPEGYALSAPSQQVLQAQRDWVRAKLRLESGAVIGDEEMAEEIRTYFPQPGESEAVIAQKRQSRAQAMEQVRTQGGRAIAAPSGIPQSAADAGIDPDLWKYMSPEDQALWQN